MNDRHFSKCYAQLQRGLPPEEVPEAARHEVLNYPLRMAQISLFVWLIAGLYDHVTPYRERPDVDFSVQAARESGGPVLEIGCGTGGADLLRHPSRRPAGAPGARLSHALPVPL
ncbi:MAG: hypothetical protein JXA37_13900 [Chloroflexia bacterium]|nr:hypothetical protein [Chloroflexia bacterium]